MTLTFYFGSLHLIACRRRPQQGRAALLSLGLMLLLTCGSLAWTPPLYAQDSTPAVHVVKSGETLSEIAARYGVDAEEILALNELEDPNTIVEGQALRIPLVRPAPAGAHRVQEGETLSGIARQHGLAVAVLLQLNNLDDPNAIYAGQLLRIDAAAELGESTDTAGRPAATTPRTATAPPSTHRVAAGDTLTSIANRYDLPVADLMAWNGITDPDNVIEGQVLNLLPSPTTVLTAVATKAVAATNTSTSTPAPPSTHRVAAGETLTSIANRYDLPVAKLMAWNDITDPDTVIEGQVLNLVPGAAAVQTEAATEVVVAANTATPSPSTPPTARPGATYVVQAGETLSAIARRYGLTVDALQALNGLEDENAIVAGQELLLTAPPQATAPPTATATPTPTGAPPTATPVPLPPTPIERSGNPIASLNETYAIRSGDTLPLIALRLGLNLDALVQLNGFTDPDSPLRAGQTLVLPATGAALRPRMPAQAYVVQPGETLSAIAVAHGLQTADLLTANRITDPNTVLVGQELNIPARSLANDSTQGSGQQVGPARRGYFYYTVQPGDTLSELATQFNSTMLAIRDYNDLPDNDSVYAGLELQIPYGAPPLTLKAPPVPTSGTRFVVSLSRQQCWVYQGERVAYSWKCSTGHDHWKTKTGNYAVQSKIINAKSNVYKLDMPYWLGIYDVGQYENGIHGLPVRWDTGKKIWGGMIGQPATFGCAMLDDLEAATLYRLAYLGMPVHIVN